MKLSRVERQTLTRMQMSRRRQGALDFSVVCALESKGLCKVSGAADDAAIEITTAGREALASQTDT